MKKLIFSIAVIAMTSVCFAQDNSSDKKTMSNSGGTSFGVQVGGNLASTKFEEDDAGTTTKLKTKSKIGFVIGIVAELPIANSISFRPELNFIQKGYKFDETFDGDNFKDEVTLNYLELPLNFVYNVPAGTGNVFFGIGPSIGYGISGKEKSTFAGEPEETVDVKFDGKKDASDDFNHLKALDFGGSIIAGYKMTNGVFVTLGYNIGFGNISPDEGGSYKNSGLALKVGYNFDGSKSK